MPSRIRRMRGRLVAALMATFLAQAPAAGGTLDGAVLQRQLQALAGGFDGRVGICAHDASSMACVDGDGRYSMQSVMKLVVGAAAMDAIDQGRLRLDEPVVVRREDLSLYVQPIAKLVGPDGYRTTIGDLIARAVIESDSAATDILFARVGGARGIAAFLARKGIRDLRVDRDERHLQTESVGLTWKPAYVDADVLDRDIDGVPEARRTAAFAAYLKDPRDTSTPKAMVRFLHALATGRLLSPESARHLIAVMNRTVTFPDRLKAGTPDSWTLGHKTGTSMTWNGVNGATNDVGILTAPDGHSIVVAVFISGSRRSSAERAALMANVARAVTAAYRPDNAKH